MSPDPSTPPKPPAFKNGDVFAGRYEIIGFIASGASADVYKVEDQTSTERVALKLVKNAAGVDPKILDAFQRDLAAARKISDSQFVRILDSGVDQGYLYVTLEFVDGQSIAPLASEQKRLPMGDFLSLFRRMCGAVAPLHEEGLVHGELSFSNLVLTMDGTLKLLDFGLARYLGAGQKSTASPYMSPEQLKRGELTRASDVYALGALSFELLTGRRPSVETGRPPQVPKDIHYPIPPALAAAIEKCLDPDPAKRFQKVQDLLAATAKVKPPEPTDTTPLADVLPEDPPDPREALPLFRQMVQQVIALRTSNLTFADLSPHNFRIRENGDVELNTKPVDPRDPKYLAPEDVHERPGLQRILRAAADNYLLGFAFYEVLLGTKLFSSEFSDVLRQEDEAAWPAWHSDSKRTARPVKQVVPLCPPPLSDLVASMMEKRFDGRSSLALTAVAEQLKKIESDLEKAAARKQGKAAAPAPAPAPAPAASASAAPAATPAPRKKLNPLVLVGGGVAILVAAGIFLSGRSGTPPPDSAVETPSAGLPAAIETNSGAMLLVPGGEFPMGDPPRAVRLAGFYIDKLEVTNAQYRKFCDATSHARPRPPTFDAAYFDKGDYPVLNVSWQDAKDFAAWAGKRLPTAQEWERAARGKDGRRYPWGNALVDNTANLRTAGRNSTAPSGWYAFDLSAHGALDMGGNVAEWVEDRVICGGSYQATPEAAAVFARTTAPPGPSPSTGFRCAASPDAALKLRK